MMKEGKYDCYRRTRHQHITGGKKLKIAETKNEKFMTEQPGIKDLIFEYLPKIMKSNEKMSFKQASLLIAQFQADNKLVPIDGYISSDKSPTAQLLLDKCAEAKIAYMWTHEQRGGNNYLPNGVKFVAPIDESGKQHLTKKLKEGQNIDDAIHDVNSQCASLITFMNSGISGNAWTMPDNIINEGGEEIVNTLRNADWSSITEITTAEEIQRKIQEQVRRNPIDPKKIKVGDVITMMHPKSTFQLRAFAEGSKTDTKVVSTHVGQVTESGGILYVTHNIHGTVYSEPLSAILAGNGTAGDIATGVFRLNTGNDIISSWNRKVAKVTTKLGKEWGKIKEDTDNMFN